MSLFWKTQGVALGLMIMRLWRIGVLCLSPKNFEVTLYLRTRFMG